MGFQLPELVVESVIRDGLANIKAKPALIDDVFSSLLRTYAMRKYGAAELSKLKTLISTKEIGVVFSYHEIESNVPCFSIMVGSDGDAKSDASMGDYRDSKIETMTDEDELEGLIRVPSITVIGFDPMNGEVELDDSIDLVAAGVTQNNIISNADGDEYRISAIIKTPSKSAVLITHVDGFTGFEGDEFETGEAAEIKSSLNFHKFEINGVHSEVNIVIGVHTKDALTTKYLYILLKYFMLSRKQDLIKRDLIVSSFSGSDFTRDQAYKADRIFTRFFTLTGKVEDTWKQSEVDLIENMVVQIQVPQSAEPHPQTTESLGLESQTVQISEDIESE